MKHIRTWDKNIPLYDPEIKNEQNKNINAIQFYPVKTDKPLPVVVIFPGGGYTFRNDDDEGAPVAEFFNAQGFHAAVVNYRVFPYHYPAPLLDVQRAVKLLRYRAETLKIDPDKVFTLGFSAGGHLCGMTATFPDICNEYGDEVDKLSSKPTGAVLCYPVICADDDKMHRGSFESLLGENYPNKQAFSVEKKVSKDTCPCFVFHCENDTLVRPVNSRVLQDSLLKIGIPHEVHIFPDGCHGGGLKQNDEHAKVWPFLAANWIKSFR